MAVKKTSHRSRKVTRESHALGLKSAVFPRQGPQCIAKSLKASVENRNKPKAESFRSVLSVPGSIPVEPEKIHVPIKSLYLSRPGSNCVNTTIKG